MGMIGYAIVHVREYEISEGIAPLEERENVIGLLISELGSVWPYPGEIMYFIICLRVSVSLGYQERN